MQLHEPALEQLLHEAEEARLREALLEATGEELLERARDVSRAIGERVRQVTACKHRKAPRKTKSSDG
jgi:hypothetical protein